MSCHAPIAAADAANHVCEPQSALSKLRHAKFHPYDQDAIGALELLELRCLDAWHVIDAARGLVPDAGDVTLRQIEPLMSMLDAALAVLATTTEPMAAVRAAIDAATAPGAR